MFFNRRYIPFLIFLAALFLIELIIDPLGNFALNDDWAYARSVFVWNETGQFTIGKWPAMSLFSHSLLGLVFVKIFGFSYTVLRFSNMFFCVVTLFFLYKFLMQRSGSKLALFICLIIALNPFYLNLFNTYMTDLTFINFSFLAFYSLASYIEKGRKNMYLMLFFVLALLATFTRQIGVILFFALIIISVKEWFKNKNYFFVMNALLFTGITLCILYFFEKQQDRLTPKDAAYQGLFFNKADIKFDPDLFTTIIQRCVCILIYTGSVYLMVGGLFLRYKFQDLKKNAWVKIAILSVSIACFFWIQNIFPVGNILYNCGLGPDSTIDTVYLLQNTDHASWSFFYNTILTLFITGFLLLSQRISFQKIKEHLIQRNVLQLFLILVLVMYVILIGIAEAFMDRYALFFMFFLLAFIFIKPVNDSKLNYKFAVVTLIFIGCFSVLCNRDYLTAAHVKQNIFEELQKDGIKVEVIHAGFEYELWDGTINDFDWFNFDHYYDREYIISRGPIKDFEIHKAYPHQRFIPYIVDTLFVLKKRQALRSM